MSATTNPAAADVVLNAAEHRRETPTARTDGGRHPAAIAVDLGSGQARLWTVDGGIRVAPSAGAAPSEPTPLIRRGRIVDPAGCASLLNGLLRTSPRGLSARPVVVACRPLLAGAADTDAIRQVVSTVFAPSRVLLIDTVRAAAIGSGTAAGVLLIVDIGAELTEVAVLAEGRVITARRAEIGTHDGAPGGASPLLAGVVTRLVTDISGNPRVRPLTAAALARGVVIVGDGATLPELTFSLAANLRVPVRPASPPRLAALRGAGLAAVAACRHPAAAAA